MAAATTTMPEFLVAAQAAFHTRFGDDVCVCLPDGHALKLEEGYDGALIVLSVSFAAADPDEQQGAFDAPIRATLSADVYTATGFGDYDAKPDAYQAGLALVSDIIGWAHQRRFIEGQRCMEFASMEAGSYDVKENWQLPWIIEFAVPMRFDPDRETADDPFTSYGDYEGHWPVTQVFGKFGTADEIASVNHELVYPLAIVGQLGTALHDLPSSRTLALAADATEKVGVGDYLQVEDEFVRVTAVASQRSFTVEREQFVADPPDPDHPYARAPHATGQDVALLPRPL